MPRLTKALKEEIVEAVYKASSLPTHEKELNEQLSAAVREALLDELPENFLEVTKNLPPEWFRQVGNYYLHYSTRVVPGHIVIDPPLLCPAQIHPELPSEVRNALYERFQEQFEAFVRDRAELNTTTWARLNSYRTTEKLLKDVPEMEKFIPKSFVNYPPPAVPVSNILAKFMQMGVVLQA